MFEPFNHRDLNLKTSQKGRALLYPCLLLSALLDWRCAGGDPKMDLLRKKGAHTIISLKRIKQKPVTYKRQQPIVSLSTKNYRTLGWLPSSPMRRYSYVLLIPGCLKCSQVPTVPTSQEEATSNPADLEVDHFLFFVCPPGFSGAEGLCVSYLQVFGGFWAAFVKPKILMRSNPHIADGMVTSWESHLSYRGLALCGSDDSALAEFSLLPAAEGSWSFGALWSWAVWLRSEYLWFFDFLIWEKEHGFWIRPHGV